MCMACTPELDTTKADAFAETMVGHLNSSAITLMCSIGHQTGLFDALADLPPATSDEIASHSKLHERYVREWLGAMVTGGIIHYEPADHTYSLPAEHAAWLTRSSTPNNLAVPAQWIAVLGSVENRIVDCFRQGGGVDYGAFERFTGVMAEDSHQSVVHPLHELILPTIPGAIAKLEAGCDVLDLGCGLGRALIEMAKVYPDSRFVGYDYLQSQIDEARTEARRQGLTNIRFEQADAARIKEQEAFDLIFTFDAIHDQADPAAVLRNIYRALRQGGTYFMHDIAGSSHLENNVDHVFGPLGYTISCMHCMTVSLAQGGAGLGAMWGRELACDMLREAGFREIQVNDPEHDPLNYHYIMTK